MPGSKNCINVIIISKTERCEDIKLDRLLKVIKLEIDVFDIAKEICVHAPHSQTSCLPRCLFRSLILLCYGELVMLALKFFHQKHFSLGPMRWLCG